ncbi:methyl-accepting chemotaxis protein [Pseudoalteromonas aurantia]|uniref:Methyl-accepting chemotaxis protein n=1 Tax=Pseudoalteromonas aurantia 208 TaxID=1314867 RepID=A0ABR9EGZ5_9GAMM|nr:methyl-accepting chemotaxis protein [Pseudoalteromonas aurantia]MBE0370259.1 methyl-accepting chemotaxis protein [Pseudoalteromonas aurantia 208]
MNLTVTWRIFGGFAVVLLLSVILFSVSIMGISNIGKGIQKVSTKSVPTLISGAALSESVLATELSLIQLFATERRSVANTIKADFDKRYDENQTNLQALALQLDSLPEFAEILSKLEKTNAALYTTSITSITNYLAILTQIEKTNELAQEFGDMGDESLSFAYDLEGMAEQEATINLLATFVSLIESAVDSANSVLRSQIVFEVLGVQSELQGSVSEIDELFNKIQMASELQGSDELASMHQNLTSFKNALVGSDSAISSKVSVLKQLGKVKKDFGVIKQHAKETRELIAELKKQIMTYTGSIQSQAESTVSDNQFVITMLAGLIIVLSIAVSFVVTRSIKVPLAMSIQQIKTAATGDMTVQFVKEQEDELGEMAQSMQQLVNSLRDTLNEISDNSQLLASTAEQTSVIADQSFNSANEQSSQMHAMSTSINEMTETVSSVAASVHSTLEEVEKASTEAEQGETVLLKNVESISALGKTIEGSANVIQQLNNDTVSISSVLAEIKGIAEQTNLLALNAAIEAARAGEQGRGFAVVADEVRSLASRTQESTQEIQSAIENLISGAQQAVESMTSSQQASRECVDGINSVKNMLQSIVQSIQTIRDMSQQIAAASEQQTVAANTQLESVNSIRDITNTTTEQAKDNQQASLQLAQMAETQRTLLTRFKT